MRAFLNRSSVILIIVLILVTATLAGFDLFFKIREYKSVSSPRITLTLPPALSPDFNPTDQRWYFWNPTARVFQTASPANGQITDLPITLPPNISVINSVLWSPDHQHAIIQSNIGQTRLDFKNNKTFSLPATAQNFAWSLDSTKLAYQIVKPESIYLSEIYTIDLPSIQATRLTNLDRSSSFFTEGKINLRWGPKDTLFFSDITLDAASPDWTALTTSSYRLSDLDPIAFSPTQTQLLFTRLISTEGGAEVNVYGIKNLLNDEDQLTKLPDSFLCEWETEATLLCLNTDSSQTIARIGQYNISSNQYTLLNAVKILATQLPNNSQYIRFDTTHRQLYVVTGGGIIYSINY